MKERIKKPIVIAGIAAVLVIVAVAAVLIGMKLSKKEAYRNIEIIECMKLPYETASAEVEPVVDVVLYSNDNAFFDPWGNMPMLELN